MNRWYMQAEEDLDRELQEGLITIREYNDGIRDINLELEEQAREAAQQAHDAVFGY